MLRIQTNKKNTPAAKKYFEDELTREDYYKEDQEDTGQLYGKGAELVRIIKIVDQKIRAIFR